MNEYIIPLSRFTRELNSILKKTDCVYKVTQCGEVKFVCLPYQMYLNSTGMKLALTDKMKGLRDEEKAKEKD